MLLPLRYYGDPVLKKRAAPIKEITPEILKLIDDMTETLEAQDGGGLAAPQVGVSIRLFILKPEIEQPDGSYRQEPLRVFINPQLSHPSSQVDEWEEGCLSIPGLHIPVMRAFSIQYAALDRHGNTFSDTASGWFARQLQHETDHLDGLLTVDRTHPHVRKALAPSLRLIQQQFAQK